jgi:hypothetical protein
MRRAEQFNIRWKVLSSLILTTLGIGRPVKCESFLLIGYTKSKEGREANLTY